MRLTNEGSKEKVRFSPGQRRVLLLCILGYICAYMMRLNFSVAMPSIRGELALTNDQTGLAASLFLVLYAVGQLVWGRAGDKIKAKYMIPAGLFLSAGANLALGLAQAYGVVLAAEVLNGVAQSMLWAPIVRAIALHFEGEKRTRAAMLLNYSLVAGYALSWGCASLVGAFLHWRFIFFVPVAVTAVFLVFWLILYREEKTAPAPAEASKGSLKVIFQSKGLALLLLLSLLSALCHGVIKESIGNWLPTMLTDAGGFSTESTFGILVFVPLLNFAGLLLTKKVIGKNDHSPFVSALPAFLISLAVSVVPLLLSLFVDYNTFPVPFVVFTVLLFALMAALNPFFVTFIPMQFDEAGLVSTVTGMMDFSIYIGAAISSFLTGLLYERSGAWSGVAAMWAISMLLSLVFYIFAGKAGKTGQSGKKNSENR